MGQHVWRNFQLMDFNYGRVVFTEKETKPEELEVTASIRREGGLLLDRTIEKTVAETTRRFRVLQTLQTHHRQLREPSLESASELTIARPDRIARMVEKIPDWLTADVRFAVARDFEELVEEQTLSDSSHSVTTRRAHEKTIKREFSSSTRDSVVRGAAGLAAVTGAGLAGMATILDSVAAGAVQIDPAVILAGHWVIAGWHPNELKESSNGRTNRQ